MSFDILFPGYGIDFNHSSFWQPGHLIAHSGRLVAFEVLCIDGIHRSEIGDGIEQDRGLYPIVETKTCFFEYVAQIVQAASGLSFNSFGELSAVGVCGQLPGDEQGAVKLNGLGVRSYGCGSLGGCYVRI